jgi:hypothetical protein
MSQDNKESALSRWSRRKLEADQLAPMIEESAPMNIEADLNAADQAAAEAKPVLTDADMPDIESLDEDSDFSGFMSMGVSDELRNLALRKLFKAPVFNIRDGLDEYDEDYTYFEKLGDIVTCDMKHQIEMQEKKLREAQEAEEAEAELDEIVDEGIVDQDMVDEDIVDEDMVDEDMEAMEMAEDEEPSEPDAQSEIVAEADLEPETGSRPSLKKEADDE